MDTVNVNVKVFLLWEKKVCFLGEITRTRQLQDILGYNHRAPRVQGERGGLKLTAFELKTRSGICPSKSHQPHDLPEAVGFWPHTERRSSAGSSVHGIILVPVPSQEHPTKICSLCCLAPYSQLTKGSPQGTVAGEGSPTTQEV